MNDKKLRKRMNKIRAAMTIITNELNLIYSDNAEEDVKTWYAKLVKQQSSPVISGHINIMDMEMMKNDS